jgi:hypothetical protein
LTAVRRRRFRKNARAGAGALAALVLAGAGCGRGPTKPPASCVKGAGAIVAALRAAPQPVRLAGGTRLSTCVYRAHSDADLKTVGAIYTQVADGLTAQVARSDAAALRLGYLTGAVRRGASGTNGTATELVRRVEQAAGLNGPPSNRRAAYARGIAAGARNG